MDKIKFISYDGKYPNLCGGILVVSLNDIEYIIESPALVAGGWLEYKDGFLDPDSEPHTGAWSINMLFVPDELKEYESQLIRLVNLNIQEGHCGGCLKDCLRAKSRV